MNRLEIDIGKGNTLAVFIPSQTGGGHTIEVPFTVEGLRVLQRILLARKRERSTIGMEGAPTQELIRKWLATNKPQTPATKRIGIDPNELEFEI